MSERVIVSMTSYPGRIKGIGKIIFSILSNTMKPDKIVINLSIEEFPNKEKDLPEDLQALQENGLLEIWWVEKNIKQFKKIIPTLERYPNDIIISIDDDLIYPKEFIETIYNDYLKYDRKYPITAGTWIDRGFYNNKPSHHGSFTLIKKEMFGKNFELMKDLIQKELWKNIWFDDPLYTYMVMNNGLEYKLCSWDGFNYKRKFNVRGVSNSRGLERMKEHNFLRRFL